MKPLRELEQFFHLMLPAEENSEEAFAWFTGLPHPLFNAVMHCTAADKVETFLAQVPKGLISFWMEKGNPLRQKLEERGFQSVMSCPIMAWQVAGIAGSGHPIKAADEAFFSIIETVFQFDPALMAGYIRLLNQVPAENYLIYAEGKPVGTGTLIANGKTGGIFNIAVLPEYQKRGLGKGMMQFLMHRAHQLKMSEVVLQSSPPAEPLYANLGFKNCLTLDIYV